MQSFFDRSSVDSAEIPHWRSNGTEINISMLHTEEFLCILMSSVFKIIKSSLIKKDIRIA